MDAIKNCWYVAAWDEQLENEKLLARTLLGRPIVIFRAPDGSPQAIEDRCPHRSAPLSLGKLTPTGSIRCAYHGLEFDGTGQCVHNPHTSGRIPPKARVRSFPVVEKHSLIWVWMGQQPADTSLIPDFSILDGGMEISKRDYLRMEANYALVTDNLMDLSHTAFLHEGILGSEQTIKADLKLTQNGHQVHVARMAANVPVPGLFDLMYKRDGGLVDFWADIRWDPPGCMVNDTGVTDPGRSRAEGTGIYGMHFLTPETDTTCHYHFAAARQNPISWGEPIDTEIRTKISELRRYAFEFQDRIVIEAQQRLLSGLREPPAFVLLETDLGTVRFRRILDTLLAAEKNTKLAGVA